MNIERISLSLSQKLGEKLNKTNEEVAVLNYGLFVILHTLISAAVMLGIGYMCGLFIEVLIISICSSMVKRYSGGVHASSPGRCTVIGVIMSITMAVICRVCADNMSTYGLISTISIGFIICYILLYEKCPVPSKNKPMKKESTRKLLRKKTFSLINVLILIELILGVLYITQKHYLIKVSMISILLGIIIQVFALSNIGSKFILYMDKLLCKFKCK